MASTGLISIFVNLAVTLLIALLIYNLYKNRENDPSERYSTFWPRFWSPTIDSVVVWPIVTLAPYLILDIFPSRFVPVTIATTLFYYIYSIYLHGKFGGTIGKLKCKILVVDAKTEQQINFKQAFYRDSVPLIITVLMYGYVFVDSNAESMEHSTAFTIIPSLFLLWFLAEIVTMLTNQKRRALHDFIAGTVVIRTGTETGDTSNEAVEKPPIVDKS